jgi:RND family efflux transporter MFP subunit
VSEIAVDLGSRVRKGQIVARIDPSDYRLRVAQAEAALQQARVRLGLPAEGTSDKIDPEQTSLVRQAAAMLKEARLTHDRMAELWKGNYVARADLDTAVSKLAVAEGQYQDAIEEIRNRQGLLVQRRSELEISRQQLADTAIVSPMDGAVSERQASVGQYLAAGASAVTLVRIDPLRLRLAVPEREAGAVRVGQTVELTVEGDSAKYSGRVARLSPAIAENNRTLLIEAEVPNGKGMLRPGSFAKADIVIEAGQEIITVPRDSVINFAGIEKVLMVVGGKAVEKRVRTGRRIGEQVEVIEGIVVGNQVIVQPGNLVAGQPVAIVN